MAADIYIVSGFLGAGKTTLIRKLLKEAFNDKKVVLIENDFGEISLDAALMRAGGVEVREINSGCICCSLSGDFVKALKEAAERFHPDVIIIEPSGVGKLSDIIKACREPGLKAVAEFKTATTVADAKRCRMYFENFGEFFKDQIENADTILMSHTDITQDKLDAADELIKKLNPKAAVYNKPWDNVKAEDILKSAPPIKKQDCKCKDCGCGHSHHHDHSHSADEAFDTVTITTDRKFTKGELEACMRKAEKGISGNLVRAKGIVSSAGGYFDLQYVPGELKILPCLAAGNALCFIGRNLSKIELSAAFGQNWRS